MRELEKIPQNSNISIYGAGEAGYRVKIFIEKNRPDLNLVCFFDKNPKENFEGKKVHPIKDINEKRALFDFVIIASYLNYSIMENTLKNLGIKNYIKSATLPIPEIKDQRILSVQNILFSTQSKEIFELAVKAYNCKNCLELLKKYVKHKNEQLYPQMHEQYFDFIKGDKIKTVISGGAYDGGTSLLFLDRFNAEKIFAFEPMYEKFKNELNDSMIKKTGKIEMIQLALLDKTCQINFEQRDVHSKINPAFPIGECSNVDAISIDDFVKERKIEKVDFIKMDLEGCEMLALKGATETITKHRPQLAICIYHSYNDLFEIPLYLSRTLQNYRFEVYHYSPNTNWETVLYAIPNEILS